MSLISGFCFGINIFIILTCFKKGADPLSPARVFGFVWALCIGLTDLKLSRFQHTWSIESWLVFVGGIAAFLIGILMVSSQHVQKQLLTISQIRVRLQAQARNEIDSGKFFIVIITLFISYLACYIIEVVIIGNVPIFSQNVERARVDFGIFGFHLLVNANVAIMFLVVEYYLFVRNERAKKYILGLVFFITTGTFFLLLQRYNFFYWAALTLPFVYYSSRLLRLRNLVVLGGVFFSFLYAIRNIRITQYVEQYHYVVSKMRYSSEYAGFTEPYMYIVMNLENFARGVDKLEQFNWGYFTFDVAMALSGLKHWLGGYFNIDRFPFLISGYNTYTFHWWYYYDFGVIGVVVFPLIVGLISSYYYFQMRIEPTINFAIIYSICFVLMIIGFISNPLTRLESVFNFSLILFVNLLILKKTKFLCFNNKKGSSFKPD